ncbi:MAG: D-alanine--D-alanine ligase [Spirochaetia bacterium]|nr:D-alanine--D-alanine ligase [Spirochaetia bacterium]
MRKTIILLYGGNSPEHSVSCVSAAAVYQSLTNIGYPVMCIGITRNSRLYLQKPSLIWDDSVEAYRALIERNEELAVTIVPGKGLSCGSRLIADGVLFPLTHGAYGEDGRLQGMLDFLPIPYIGSSFSSSFIGFSKYTAKLYWEKAGLPVVDYICVDSFMYDGFSAAEPSTAMLVHEISESLGLPVYIKPESSGSSIGITRAGTLAELYPALEKAADISRRVLIEKAINCREIECSVFDTRTDLFVSQPGEIAAPGQFYNYEYKYSSKKHAACITIPAELPQDVTERIRKLAAAGYRALSCCGMARADMFFDRDSGAVYLNEINTIPGFTETSMYMQLVKSGGFDWNSLMEELIRTAEKELNARWNSEDD